MTGAGSEVTLSAVCDQLDGLADLFKRRLLDDRTKQTVIEDLQARLTRAERAVSATALKPVVEGLALVIERLQAVNPEDDLHVIDELQYVLESLLGVTPIQANAGDPVERLRHEIASASGEGNELRVAELVRTGYEKDGVVLRPAKVMAVRVPGGTGPAVSEAGDLE